MLYHLRGVLAFLLATATISCNGPVDQESTTTPVEEHKYAYLLDKSPDSLNYTQLYNRALNLWKIPFEEIDCLTQYGNAHVIVTGPEDAPPLVLLHGMNASSTMWYPNIEALSENHRVYAIDFLLEVNKSAMNGDVAGTPAVMNWYNEVFTCLGLTEFEIIGASRGGWLATQFAIENPEKVQKLVLLSPAQALIWIPPSKKMLTNIMYTMRPKREDLRESLEALSNDVDKISQLYIDQYFKATTEAEVSSSLLEMTPFDDEDLAKLTMPVILLIGDNDFINNESSIEQARENIPNVNAATIKNAGHFLSIDQAEEVNSRVVEFLAKGK